MVAALLLAAPALVPAQAHAAGPTACKGQEHGACRHSPRAGRRGARAPRRSTAARRGRGIPWLKGSLPNVQAQGAFVLDLAGGQELYARRPDEPRPIASISKLAAALTVVDRGLDLEANSTISRGDAEVARGGARSRLLEGMTVSNRDLLHAALLGSDNRAVPALGRAVGLDAGQLAVAMTQKARELGLRNTRFIEPTGLSPENVSTPREIVELMRAVMDHPVLGEMTRKVEYDAHPVGRAPIRYFATYRAASRHNTLVLGAKTGFNNAARYCLVLGARVAGRTVAMAFLGTDGEMTRFGDVARVADWVVAQEARAFPRESVVAQAIPTSGAAAAMSPVPPSPPLSAVPALSSPFLSGSPAASIATALSLSPAAPPVPAPAPLVPPSLEPSSLRLPGPSPTAEAPSSPTRPVSGDPANPGL
jgi:serine-type D-Ala-D-Ala endopeptidase (penicillin-binding protein 7)